MGKLSDVWQYYCVSHAGNPLILLLSPHRFQAAQLERIGQGLNPTSTNQFVTWNKGNGGHLFVIDSGINRCHPAFAKPGAWTSYADCMKLDMNAPTIPMSRVEVLLNLMSGLSDNEHFNAAYDFYEGMCRGESVRVPRCCRPSPSTLTARQGLTHVESDPLTLDPHSSSRTSNSTRSPSRPRTRSPSAAGHGTHVASLAAGAGTSAAGEASVYALRWDATYDIAAAYSALLGWAQANAAESGIINTSFASPVVRNDLKCNAMKALVRQGLLTTVATGNGNSPVASFSPPSCAPFELTVGNVIGQINYPDALDRPSPFSNFGPEVDIWAPGYAILTYQVLTPKP